MEEARALPLDGVHNFRDYGGYCAHNGRLKMGLLWRSGQHADATDDDLRKIDQLKLRNVMDFRGISERAKAPCKRGAGFCAEIHNFDGETAGLAPHIEAASGAIDQLGAHNALSSIYANLPRRTPVLWMIRRYFEVLASGERASLVHCVAGKDRTGMAVYLFHHAMGVHKDDAMSDYLLTNSVGNSAARIEAGFKGLRAKYGNIDDATIRILMGVDERYIDAMCNSVEAEYGSIDHFLENACGVTSHMREQLRDHFIEG